MICCCGHHIGDHYQLEDFGPCWCSCSFFQEDTGGDK